MFRFTIRELLLLTVIVALGVGWWVDHRRLQGSATRARFVLLLLYDAVYDGGLKVNWPRPIDEELNQLGFRPPMGFHKEMKLLKSDSNVGTNSAVP